MSERLATHCSSVSPWQEWTAVRNDLCELRHEDNEQKPIDSIVIHFVALYRPDAVQRCGIAYEVCE